ncbi:MAG TPA: non-canonical purine NTP pyrophosphatase [Anaeromyxobacteraceae bacterium]|nr:non-canonical purine NTP pyrophosphatase [Anaeromyxobacteraceae bacterium]
MDLFFGTRNPGKLEELRRLVAGLPVRVVSPEDLPRPPPEVEEDGATMAENAEKKAVAYARATGMPALADDSGICVDVLWGLPGVRSARWSEDLAPGLAGRERDRANNAKLLGAMAGVPTEHRGAEYRAVVALARPDGTLVATAAGTCRGTIGTAERGRGGFGYDPLFIIPGGPPAAPAGPPRPRIAAASPSPVGEQSSPPPPGQAPPPAPSLAREELAPRTMAELSPAEKDAISHRGQAMRKILPAIRDLAATG